MTPDRDGIIQTLDSLITLNKDSAKGFARAENDVEDEELASWFDQLKEERASLVDDLQQAANRLGEEVEEEASAAGALQRGWLNIKAAMTIEHDKTDAIVLDDRTAHEEDVLDAYEEALAEALPSGIRALLQEQQRYLRRIRQELARRGKEIETSR
jgi:uncharacterized protein (TIGR02284 family)